LWFRHVGPAGGQTRVILGAGEASGVALPWHTAGVLAAVAVTYACSLIYFAGRLAWGMWTTDAMRRQAVCMKPTAETAQKIEGFRLLLGCEGEVQFANSPAISGPAAVGLRRHTLLLPPGFIEKLSANDLDAVLAHEFAHMRRQDFGKNLFYGIISLPGAYHPLLMLTRTRLAETRELVCDAMAAEAVGGRESYARSLLQLARMLSDRTAPRLLHAIGILDANIFERRVMHLTRRSVEVTGARRLAIAAACALVAFGTCASALALRMEVTEPATQNPGPNPASVNVKADYLVITKKVPPVYPDDAKKAHVTGKVVLAATIGADGAVEQLRVVSGPSPLQTSALDAVRQWVYKPYLLNGKPIEVKTTITVVYTLSK